MTVAGYVYRGSRIRKMRGEEFDAAERRSRAQAASVTQKEAAKRRIVAEERRRTPGSMPGETAGTASPTKTKETAVTVKNSQTAPPPADYSVRVEDPPGTFTFGARSPHGAAARQAAAELALNPGVWHRVARLSKDEAARYSERLRTYSRGVSLRNVCDSGVVIVYAMSRLDEGEK